MFKKGFLLMIASPSGGGKSTICREILSKNNSLCYSISWTTRVQRGEERHGKEYFFTDIITFREKITQNYFLEYAEVHGNYYGTSKEYIDQRLIEEKIVLLDIDVQGVNLIKDQGYNVVTIFVLPPSFKELQTRLVNRKTDSQENIENRLKNAQIEIEKIPEYDYLVINDDLEKAVITVDNILSAEQNKIKRYVEPIKNFYIS